MVDYRESRRRSRTAAGSAKTACTVTVAAGQTLTCIHGRHRESSLYCVGLARCLVGAARPGARCERTRDPHSARRDCDKLLDTALLLGRPSARPLPALCPPSTRLHRARPPPVQTMQPPNEPAIPGIFTSEHVELDVPALGSDARPPAIKYTYAACPPLRCPLPAARCLLSAAACCCPLPAARWRRAR